MRNVLHPLVSLAVVSLGPAPVHAEAIDQRPCTFNWVGDWQLSAEGKALAIYSIRPAKAPGNYVGSLLRYSGMRQSLDEATFGGAPQRLALSRVVCSGKSLNIERKTTGGDTSIVEATAAMETNAWLEIGGLPDGLASPRYRLTKVPDGTTLQPLQGLMRSRFIDLWGRDNQMSNEDLASLFEADQAAREEIAKRGGFSIASQDAKFMAQWAKGDRERLLKAEELLRQGAVRSGYDYYRAAFIFQHGSSPDHFLRAHHLALMALALGATQAKWIAAASLDRFLLSIDRSQIYGTQTHSGSPHPEVSVDLKIVSDTERQTLGVEPQR